MERLMVQIGSVAMFLGVAAGAFGAHALSDHFGRYPDLERTFQTAVRYHMIHGLAIFLAAWIGTQWQVHLATWAGWLFLAGIFLFSGTLYLLSLTNLRWLGAITPLGGMAFLGGWLALFLAVWRTQ